VEQSGSRFFRVTAGVPTNGVKESSAPQAGAKSRPLRLPHSPDAKPNENEKWAAQGQPIIFFSFSDTKDLIKQSQQAQ